MTSPALETKDTEPTGTRRHPRRRPPADFVLACLGVVAILAVIVPAAFDGYDNDVWFILASGRRVVEEGFPSTNPWAVYQGLRIVIQQWLPDVLAYAFHAAWGWYGLTALLLLVCATLALCLYRLGRACSPSARPETILLFSALALVGLQSYISYRPQVYTMVFMCLTLTVMERYRRKGRPRELLWLVPIELAHVNFHASMAAIDIAIVVAYAVPNLRAIWDRLRLALGRRCHAVDVDGRPLFAQGASPRRSWDLSQADYPRLPLVVVACAMALSMLANPYGADGALYLVHSIGAASYGNYIEEMKALMPTTAQFGVIFLAVVALALVLVGRRGPRHIDLPLTACVLVLGYLGFEHVRNVWLVVPFAYVLLLKCVRRLPLLPGRIVTPTRGLKTWVCALCAVVMGCLLVVGVRGHATSPERDGANTPTLGADALDALVPADQRSSTGVFCTFEAGGYLEWRGYQVSMDARPELWEPGVTGVEEHYYQQYVDMMNGSRGVGGELAASGCEYVIAKSSSVVNSYLEGSDDYVTVLVGTQYQVWRRR